MTPINIEEIATKTMECIHKAFGKDLFISARVVRYDLNVLDGSHLCDVAITICSMLWAEQLQKIVEAMNEINCNEDMQDILSFCIGERRFMIGDGDDSHSCRFVAGGMNAHLVVWVRSF